ncbi:MAG: phage protein GemA/Gp16 family protein [Shimia sp.]
MQDSLRRQVFAGCRQLGLDDETRRELQIVATGKASMTEMDESDLRAVVAALEARGFRKARGGRHAAAPRGDIRYVHRLWTMLGQAGKLDRPGRAGLNAFIRARFSEAWGAAPRDVDDLREADKITAVIRALEAMCRREGVALARGS